MADTAPAERHRAYAGGFTALVTATTDWDAPAPVEGWTARDVVDHLVTWLPGLLASDGVELPGGPPPAGADPVAAWGHHAEAVQDLLDDPATRDRPFTNPHLGTLPLGEAIDRFYTTDVLLHSWDLAMATGQPHPLQEQACEEMLAGMRPMEELMRSSGQYGAAVPVPDDAPAADRLMGFLGRDPAWAPPTSGPT